MLGIGDDAALLEIAPGMQLAISVDAMVLGRHFSPETTPEAVGYKALAVNLSDMAAMGAEPAWATLALTLPEPDTDFLAGFATGFYRLAKLHGVDLVGGDTVRGPLQVVVQIHGLVPRGKALTRSGARPGDHLFVTGTLGDAGAGLALAQATVGNAGSHADELRRRLDYPTPRVQAGLSLRGIASSAIDISDGMLADLGHILDASSVGAEIELDAVPISTALESCVADTMDRLRLALSAGDDYELCFTVPEDRLADLHRIGADWECGFTRIGRIVSGSGIVFRNGELPGDLVAGFDHFGGTDGRK